MDDDDISQAATELLSEECSIAAKALFGALNDLPASEVATNIMSVLTNLAIRDPQWSRIAEKSMEKKGRCPKQFRPILRKLLGSGGAREAASAKELDLTPVFADLDKVVETHTDVDYRAGAEIKTTRVSLFSGKRRAEIRVSRDLSDMRRMEAMACLIRKLTTEDPDEVWLDFADVNHIYVVGLAAFAAWYGRFKKPLQVVNASTSTRRYLEQVGFANLIANNNSEVEESVDSSSLYTLAIEEILPRQQAELLAARLADMIAYHMPVTPKDKSGLLVTFAELIENVHRHAGPDYNAFACAQVYPKQNKITICIVDTGLGLRESIMTGSNLELKRRLHNGESPAKLATSPLTTSKPDRHSGYGLYVASELAVRNRGTFRIFSGNEVLTFYRDGFQRVVRRDLVKDGWQGTWIAMLLDLKTVLPLADVYQTLPPSDGADVEEFFSD